MIIRPTGARRAFGVAFSLAVVAGCSQQPTAPTSPALSSGIALQNFDKGVRPQDDFYRYVNGTWLKTDQIPADRSNYGTFTRLEEDAEQQLLSIIESATRANAAAGSDEQKVGDFYESFMDEARLEKLGLAPLQGELKRIRAVEDKKGIPALMAHLGDIGVSTPVGLTVDQDAKEPTQYITQLSQSGLGLPDRDYYLSDDPKMQEMRAKYVAHIEKMLALAGDKNAGNNAKAVFDLETKLAKTQWSRVDSRDDDKTYNKLDRAGLKTLAPMFSWDDYFAAVGVSAGSAIVAQPSAFTGFSGLLKSESVQAWRAYFRWHLISDYAPYLSSAFVDENFAFFGQTLNGQKENRPRWKRGVTAVQGGLDGPSPFARRGLGEVLGKLYVARYFPPEAKARMETLVKNLLAAYHDSIQSLDWMSPETRQRALDKLAKFTTKIGYPNKWVDYSTLTIKADDLVGNLMRGAQRARAWRLAHLGKPVDRDEWAMTPQIVNAYYNSRLNEIVFPAAILRPPFFNLAADDAVNYGGIGAVIGHEIGHGFDDQGSKFDGDGRLQSWWTPEDRAKFEAKTKALIAQFNAFEPLPGHHVNGALTIGENIGDLGGASIALRAYHLSLGGKPAPELDGYSGDQRFFIGFAQVWARQYREPNLIQRLTTDPHSPHEYRCNGPLTNVSEFDTAFNVKPGDRMYVAPGQRIRIW